MASAYRIAGREEARGSRCKRHADGSGNGRRRGFGSAAAFVATAIVTLYAAHVHPLDAYEPLVAGVVQLLPGLQLTAALHEFDFRNLVADTARLGGVPMTVLSIGCGFALGIAVLQNARLADFPIVFASCGLAELTYRLFTRLPAHHVAAFARALVVGQATTIGAKYARILQAVVLVPGLFILVPAAFSYESRDYPPRASLFSPVHRDHARPER